jgi:hypothetical protein
MTEQSEPNLKQWVLTAADGKPILGVVLGTIGWDDSRPGQKLNELLSWAEAEPMLDYQFYDGSGGAQCNALYAWTEDRVISVGEYDGSTGIQWVPRNPQACKPEYR